MDFDFTASPSSQDWASLLDRTFARCEGAYADITLRGYRYDLDIFARWCDDNDCEFLPASPAGVAAFVDDMLARYSYATIKRRIAAIQFAHRLTDLPSPFPVRMSIFRYAAPGEPKAGARNRFAGLRQAFLSRSSTPVHRHFQARGMPP